MSQLPSRLTAIIAATTVAGVSGVAIAGAATSGSSAPSTTPSAQAPRAGETPLTGDTKQQVEAAALAKVPGTVIRTETDSDGVYESHIRRSDGTEVEVKVGKDFTVTSVQERPAGGGRGHGPGGPGGLGMRADLAAVAKDLGVSEADLTKALQAARPQTPANGARPQRGADEAAAIAKELGVDATAAQAVLDADRPDHGPGRGHDDTALVAALVKRFSVGEAKAQAAVDAARKAHEAEHQARETAMYAAVAKALGKDAAAVQKAFEAHRPARP
jgi:hypothetical protein